MGKDRSKPCRSLMKAVSWQSISFVLTGTIIYLFTGDLCFTFELTFTCQLIKILFFYCHERMWHQIRWGKE